MSWRSKHILTLQHGSDNMTRDKSDQT